MYSSSVGVENEKQGLIETFRKVVKSFRKMKTLSPRAFESARFEKILSKRALSKVV